MVTDTVVEDNGKDGGDGVTFITRPRPQPSIPEHANSSDILVRIGRHLRGLRCSRGFCVAPKRFKRIMGPINRFDVFLTNHGCVLDIWTFGHLEHTIDPFTVRNLPGTSVNAIFILLEQRQICPAIQVALARIDTVSNALHSTGSRFVELPGFMGLKCRKGLAATRGARRALNIED